MFPLSREAAKAARAAATVVATVLAMLRTEVRAVEQGVAADEAVVEREEALPGAVESA